MVWNISFEGLCNNPNTLCEFHVSVLSRFVSDETVIQSYWNKIESMMPKKPALCQVTIGLGYNDTTIPYSVLYGTTMNRYGREKVRNSEMNASKLVGVIDEIIQAADDAENDISPRLDKCSIAYGLSVGRAIPILAL
jgi:hypothetical protein